MPFPSRQEFPAGVQKQAPVSIVVTGASGKLGLYLMREGHDLGVVGWTRQSHDLLHADKWQIALKRQAPSAVIHAAALSTVDDCLRDAELARRINAGVAEQLARHCQQQGVTFVYVSTDMVFDGEAAPYAEDAPVKPLSQYGQSKAAGEQAVLHHGGVVVRVALMVGPALGKRLSHFDVTLERLKRREPVGAFQDEWRGMLSYRDASRGLLHIAREPGGERTGVFHLAGPRLSRLEFCQMLAGKLECPELVEATSRVDFVAAEPRARDLSLDCQRARLELGWAPEPLESQLDAWLA